MWSGEGCGFLVFQLQVFCELCTHSDKTGLIHHKNKLTVKYTLLHIFKEPIIGINSLICDRIYYKIFLMMKFAMRSPHMKVCILPLLDISKVNNHIWSYKQTLVEWTCWLSAYVRECFLYAPSLRTMNNKTKVKGWPVLCVCVTPELTTASSHTTI
jgi:hypothetical protein